MFDRYINYNQIAEEVIKNRGDNLEALKSLKEQYEEFVSSMDGIRGIQYDSERVQKGVNADAMANRLIRKESLEERIHDLEHEDRLYRQAWKHLGSEERKILEAFYQQKKGKRRQDAIDMLTEQLGYEQATLYRKRTAAVNRFRQLLFG